MDGLAILLISVIATPVLSGGAWLVYKVISHDAWLGHIKATVERIEAKLDRLMEAREH